MTTFTNHKVVQSSMNKPDTIVAIATAAADAAIGIIRLSGDKAIKVLGKIFQPYNKGIAIDSFPAGQCILGDLIIGGQKVDQVLAVIFRQPNSYTGEDIVEIHAHGGFTMLQLFLQAIIKLGPRLAENGEFTKRAFLNNKIDLTKAEAVKEIINASSLREASLFKAQLDGKLAKRVNMLKKDLLFSLAQLNAAIDFSDEDIAPSSLQQIKSLLQDSSQQINKDLQSANSSIAMHHGYTIVIAGSPNAGKSSLLNKLLSEQRAIVSDIPGTTRDTISAYINIEGFKIELVDTAGLHHTTDILELAGINKTEEYLQKADIVLWLQDLTSHNKPPIHLSDNQLSACKQKIIEVGAKKDLLINKKLPAWAIDDENKQILTISTVSGEGLPELYQKILQTLKKDSLSVENALIFNTRQKEALQHSLLFLQTAIRLLDEAENYELVCFELQNAIYQLGQIIGEVDVEEVLDEVFNTFCIGK